VNKFTLTASAAAISALIAACGETTGADVTDDQTETAAQSEADPAPTADDGGAAPGSNEDNAAAAETDPYLWLEEVESERALDQVREWNAATLDVLKADPRYGEFYDEALEIVNSQDKIAYPSQLGGQIYNFWQDDTHVKGIWRRASRDAFIAGEPDWETVLDLDALAEEEGENWVWRGASCAEPDQRRCMLTLSPGGSDAAVRREFDLDTASFVEDGFTLPVAKGATAWINEDALLVATDWGEGSITESGYPYIVKRWSRGAPLEDAAEVLRGESADVGVFPFTVHADGRTYVGYSEANTFYDTTWWAEGPDGEPRPLPLPAKSSISDIHDGQLLVSLQEDWSPESGGAFTAGQLVSFDYDAWLETGSLGAVQAVYTPDARSAFQGATATAAGVIVTETENVQGRAWLYSRDADGAWTAERIPLAENSVISLSDADRESTTAFFSVENMLTPDTLYAVDLETLEAQVVSRLPEWFDSSTMTVEQLEATSADGTQIPYFVMRPRDQEADGDNPTLLYGYGGFQVTVNPTYSALRGRLWVENGGTFVLANIRGGGEFGPAWHQAGLKTNRQVIYDDFIAVAEDLIDRGVTRPEKLGAIGGSNGGLLMGVMYTQRPDLWGAIVCQVPLLDMLRYHKLLAGASWVGEYGSPDVPEERAFLASISPYHNVEAETDYPPIFFVTSTKDDRVHPGHARKMAARLAEHGHEFDYYENIAGGHSAAANLIETANRVSLEYAWLWRQLGGERPLEAD